MIEISFYYSFKKFEDNYESDLKKWLTIYEDGNEEKFLLFLLERYSFKENEYKIYYVLNLFESHSIAFKEVSFEYFTNLIISILKNKSSNSELSTEILLEFKKSKDILKDNVLAEFIYIDEQLDFLLGMVDIDLENKLIKPNLIKHRNYFFAQNKIQDYINVKLEKYLNKDKALVRKEVVFTPISKNSKLTQKECALLGRLFYEEFFNYESPKPTKATIANAFHQIFGYSETTLNKDMKGMSYDQFRNIEINQLKGKLKGLIDKLDNI